VEQSNFHDCRVARTNFEPREICVHLTPGDFSTPFGDVREPTVPPIAPALCHPMFVATGTRIRGLPLGDKLNA